MNYHGQKRTVVEDVGSIALVEEVNHVVGVTVTTITAPSSHVRHLVLVADVDDWRVKTGTHPSLLATAPAASVTDGTGSLLLKEGDQLVIPAPDAITVAGPNSGSTLSYFWA